MTWDLKKQQQLIKKKNHLQEAGGCLGLRSCNEFFYGKRTRVLALNGGWHSGRAVVTEAGVGKGSVFMVSQLQLHSTSDVSHFHGHLTPS